MQNLIVPAQVKRELARILSCSEQMEQKTDKLSGELRTHGHLVKSPLMDTAIEALTDIRKQIEAVRALFEDRAGLTLEGAKQLLRIETDTPGKIKEAML